MKSFDNKSKEVLQWKALTEKAKADQIVYAITDYDEGPEKRKWLRMVKGMGYDR